MVRGLIRTTLRIDNNLKTRIELLAKKNNLSFNKMITYIIELGYGTYMEKFDKYYEEQDMLLKNNEWFERGILMKKLTVRIDDYIYDRLILVAKENSTSINKVVHKILKKVIDQPKEMNYIEEINNNLSCLINELSLISKRQSKSMLITKQLFANHGYLSNADINDDKCLNEILARKDKFND